MPRKSPGGPRGAVLSVRIPEKAKFGLTLLSRLHHEPIPDIVVRAINDGLMAENSGLYVSLPGEGVSRNLLDLVWADTESDRFANLALRYPILLSAAERRLWEHVAATERYWKVTVPRRRKPELSQTCPRDEQHLVREVLAEDWNQLRSKWM